MQKSSRCAPRSPRLPVRRRRCAKRRTGRRPAGPRSETYSLTPWPLISRRLALIQSAGLRKRRQQLLKEAEGARAIANDAANAQTLADERTRHSQSALDAAVASRDAALPAFPEGVDAALVAARAALAAGIAEKEKVAAEFASLERTIDERKKRIDAVLGNARTNAAKATIAVDKAQGDLTTAKTDHALHDGRLIELRKLRDAENLADAETRLLETTRESCGVARS